MGYLTKKTADATPKNTKMMIENDYNDIKIVTYNFSRAIGITKNNEIIYFLLIVDKRNNEIGYKAIHEQSGPSYYDVPLKYLNLNCENANNEWRKECKEHMAFKSKINSLKYNDIVKIWDGTVYRMLGVNFFPVQKKRGCIIMRRLDNSRLQWVRKNDINEVLS